MDQESLSEKEPAEIRQQIEETRSAISEKLETLEVEVSGTVHEAVESVRRTFDIRHQTRAHPWPMVGGAIMAGYVLGALSARRRPAPPSTLPAVGSSSRAVYKDAAMPGVSANSPGVLSRLVDYFGDEIVELRKLAIGTGLGYVRDALKSRLPDSLSHQVEGIMDSTTRKLGGKPVGSRVSRQVG